MPGFGQRVAAGRRTAVLPHDGAVTGATAGLAFVSPKTGRAVSVAGAGEWADRLLPLPPCLRGEGPEGLAEALGTTGHFLERLMRDHGDKPVPEARRRLVDLIPGQG